MTNTRINAETSLLNALASYATELDSFFRLYFKQRKQISFFQIDFLASFSCGAVS